LDARGRTRGEGREVVVAICWTEVVTCSVQQPKIKSDKPYRDSSKKGKGGVEGERESLPKNRKRTKRERAGLRNVDESNPQR